ncbi:MAG: imidazole glycerol phosphate synthase subunit HisH [Lentisphaerota bacterium]
MIGIVDYGMGNLGSVTNACRFLGLPAEIVAEPSAMARCSALILPGVGAFGDCMAHLSRHGFVDPVKQWLADDKPFLGICLGLQLLFKESEESPGVKGLGVLQGRIRRFQPSPDLKVPQIGWNRVKANLAECPLFRGIPDKTYFYFVHSYYAETENESVAAGFSEYGMEYVSAVWKKNMMAVQFHPEKSQKSGLQMLKNFAEFAAEKAGRS